MDVTVEATSAVKRKLSVIIEADQVGRAWRQAVRKVAGQVRIPGFRPGKAPAQLIERRFGASIRDDVLEKLLGKAVPDAIESQGLEPIGTPELHEVGELRSDKSLSASFSIEVLPELTIAMPDGEAITADVIEPDDEDVDGQLEKLRDKHAGPGDVDGPAEDADDVAASLRIYEQGVEPAEEREERHVHLGTPDVAAWMHDAIVGRRVGDQLDVDFVMSADESHPLAGKPCHLDGEILFIKRSIRPELDDALAALEGVDDVAALRDKAKAEVDRLAERRTKMYRRRAALGWMLDNREVPVPGVLAERELDRQFEQAFGGRLPKDDRQMMGQLRELRVAMRPQAERHVAEALLVRSLVENQECEVSDEEVQARLAQMAEEMGEYGEHLLKSYDNAEGRESIRASLTEERVLDMVLDAADLRIGKIRRLRDPDTPPEEEEAQEAPEAEAAGEVEEAAADGEAASAEVEAAPAEVEEDEADKA